MKLNLSECERRSVIESAVVRRMCSSAMREVEEGWTKQGREGGFVIAVTLKSGRTIKVQHVTRTEEKYKKESIFVGKSEDFLLEDLGVGGCLI